LKSIEASSAEQAEAEALMETLDHLSSRSTEVMQVHSDSLLLVQAVQQKTKPSWEVAGLVDRIRERMKNFPGLTLAHCSREANKPVDWVVKAHRKQILPRNWVKYPPIALLDLLTADVSNVLASNLSK